MAQRPITSEASRRTKRGSRNNKKNMRKNIDLSEIDDYLEGVRHEERTGLVLFS